MQNLDILALAGLRLDGRKYDDVRRIRLRVGVVNNADGSVYYEHGLNKVLVSVHGPQEPIRRKGNDISVDKGNIDVVLHNAPFSGTERKKHRHGDRRVVEIENAVKETMNSVIMLEMYPRSSINIIIHIFESDGSIICSILNAVCLACMDAGIQMLDMIVSCSAGYLQSQLCQDLTKIEQDNGTAYIPIAIKASSEEIVYMQSTSRINIDNLNAGINTAIAGCRKIKDIMESSIKHVMIESKNRNFDI